MTRKRTPRTYLNPTATDEAGHAVIALRPDADVRWREHPAK